MMRTFSAATLIAISVLMAGCGYSRSGTVQSGSPGNAILTIGDAPSDRILSFEITLTSIALTNASGGTVNVLSAPTRVEISHLSDTFSPLSRINVPQGTYTGASVSFANPEITFLDSNNAQVEKEIPLTNGTANVSFNPALTVGSHAMSVNLDLNLGQSVAFDAAGNPSISPVISINAAAVAAAGDDGPENGEIEDIRGTIQSVTSSSFTIMIDGGSQALTFNTNASTTFEGVTGLSSLMAGLAAEVSGATQSDGSLVATKVDVESELVGEAEIQGLVTAVTASPATSFEMVVHESASTSTTMPAMGSTTSVDVDPRTRFRVNAGKVKLGGVPFQTKFDASSLAVGQEVEASTDVPSSNSEHGNAISLHQQTLTGTVSGVTPSGSGTMFTLILASDSAFALMTGQGAVSVFAPSGTSAVSNGSEARVRGLLFKDSGAYNMVAGKITNQ